MTTGRFIVIAAAGTLVAAVARVLAEATGMAWRGAGVVGVAAILCSTQGLGVAAT